MEKYTIVNEEGFKVEAEVTGNRVLLIKKTLGKIENIGLDYEQLKNLLDSVEYVRSIKSKEMYAEPLVGYTATWGEPVEIIGEQVMEREGRLLEQYIYNKVGYTPQNGKPFVALKSNITLEVK